MTGGRVSQVHLVLASDAVTKTLGLIATFGGIGVIVNGLVVYIAIQVRGERQQNLDFEGTRRPPGA